MRQGRFERSAFCSYGPGGWACLAVLILAGHVLAASNSEVRQPYCGLYALYAAMQLEGRSVDFRELLRPEYVGAPEGSSLTELRQAAEALGMNASLLQRMTSSGLRRYNRPVILHVKSNRADTEPNHYILFGGDRDGKALIFDPPRPARLVPYEWLDPIWGRTGLVIGSSRVDASAFTRDRVWHAVGWLITIVGATGAFRLASIFGASSGNERLQRRICDGLAGAAIVALLGAIIGYTTNVLAHTGLMVDARGNNPLEHPLPVELPTLSINEVRQLWLERKATFVDARLTPDFNGGHIEGAIHIPPGLPDALRHSRVAHVPRTARVVVNCESIGCPFSDIVGRALVADGFSNVFTFRGGWREWTKVSEQSHRHPLVATP